MDKYVEKLSNLQFDLLHIAQSYANDNNSPQIEPAHILRALLHKSAGLINFIEDTLDIHSSKSPEVYSDANMN